jgi:hypothetical protein
MSTVETNLVQPSTGTTLTLGASGDTVTIPSGATIDASAGTATGFSEAAYAANASASTGAVNIDASDNLQFDSGYGSSVTAYGCRAWVNFNGTSTVAILDSGNVSSITDNGTGDYTVNFSVSMPDANYVVQGTSDSPASNAPRHTNYDDTLATGSVRVYCIDTVGGALDPTSFSVSIFR